MDDLTPRRWWIGLSPWVVQDGNHADVAVGERRHFAVELGYRRTARLRHAPAGGRTVRCAHTGRGASYDVVGEVLRTTTGPREGAVVLDVGLLVYAPWLVLDDLEPPARGAWLTGEVHLSVDPFFYRDELHALPGMPPLTYTWTVEQVERTDPADSERGWRSVPRTDAWGDEGEYRLGCRLEPGAPTRPR